MSRVTGEQIVLRPTNNVYTALAAVGVIAQVIGLVAIVIKAGGLGALL